MRNWKLSPDATEEERRALNRLAREQLKESLLRDVRLDIEVCRLEGWDCTEYLRELAGMLTDLLYKELGERREILQPRRAEQGDEQ